MGSRIRQVHWSEVCFADMLGDGCQAVSCLLSPQWMTERNFRKVEVPVSAKTECSSGSFACVCYMMVLESFLGIILESTTWLGLVNCIDSQVPAPMFAS